MELPVKEEIVETVESTSKQIEGEQQNGKKS